MITKKGRLIEIFHDAGVQRVSHRVLDVIDEAVEEVVKMLAHDVALVYPETFVETNELIRVASIKQYRLIIERGKGLEDGPKTVEELVALEMERGGEVGRKGSSKRKA